MKQPLVWMTALYLLGACGGEADDKEPNYKLTGGAPVAIDDWPAAVTEAACRAMSECDSLPPKLRYSGVANCKLMLSMGMPTTLAELQKAAEAAQAGQAKYDPAKAGECLKSVAAHCGLDGTEPEACALTFTGTLADGAACKLNDTCVSGLCKREPGQGLECEGKCTKPLAQGVACSFGDACEGDLACVGSVCAPQIATKVGESCSQPAVCAKGLFCNYDGMEPVCEVLFDEGTSCETVGVCKQGHFCKFSAVEDDSSGVCTKQSGVDGPCKHPSAPAADPMACAVGLVCLAEGPAGTQTWACQSGAGLGSACKSAKHCKYVDTWCKGEAGAGTCAVLSDKGGQCDSKATEYFYGTCRPPFQCHSESATCVELPAKGKPCLDGTCQEGLNCDADVCVEPPGKGEACFIGAGPECGASLTCDFTNSTCQPAACK